MWNYLAGEEHTEQLSLCLKVLQALQYTNHTFTDTPDECGLDGIVFKRLLYVHCRANIGGYI